MERKQKDLGAPLAQSKARPQEDAQAKMVALLQACVESLQKFEYLEQQRARELKEELAAEAAKSGERKAERRRYERMQIAATAMQGLLAKSGTGLDKEPPLYATAAVVCADALIAALSHGPAGDAAEPPKEVL